MAENAANFTLTTQNQPSIFDVIAQKSLNDTLHPGLQRIALFLSSNFPKNFHWLSKYYDETFVVLNGFLQYYYIKHYDATFSENFYGLKRILCDDSKLGDYERQISLIVTVLLPYFKRKIDEKISLYQLEEADGCLRNNFDDNLKKVLIRSRSIFELIYGLITIYNYMKYMSEQTQSQLPILRLIDMKLTYADPEPEGISFWAELLRGHFVLNKVNMLRDAASGILTSIAFFMQFLQTWNVYRANYSFKALPNVAAPVFDNRARNYRNKCPLCLQPWKIPTVLPVSGYIFCFPCIVRYLRENHKCPVTNLPAKHLDIVRLFDSE